MIYEDFERLQVLLLMPATDAIWGCIFEPNVEKRYLAQSLRQLLGNRCAANKLGCGG
jgi:hypothetical protein